ncbi:class I SAM-dependent methyltransferase [uncultured Cohaesibacter sp.]|uniref:class I SAM-dependent methyltransferase n=1 Tax=uncultured Cohaesibacter sp. TaxID=1002546 RepID=UPI0029C8F158|nr:class I SAM-dependent methyltransferase [uncultured Cohaesibacter sp.]
MAGLTGSEDAVSKDTVPEEMQAGLMDDIYRYQRLIYDLTRKYYLLGRDRLIRDMAPKDGAHILEIACGTGRNLDLIGRRYPATHLYGLDISEEMLLTARRKLGDRACLAQANACSFEPSILFGQTAFDHIVMSYSLSMIPDWQMALGEALRHLTPGGCLHLVDFGDQARLPKVFDMLLSKWLEKFHVFPRRDLPGALEALQGQYSLQLRHGYLYRHYAQLAVIRLL